MKKNNLHDMRDNILAHIQKEHVTMRPRLFFTLKLAAVALAAVCVLLLSVLFFNFIFYIARINDHAALIGFGTEGVRFFLNIFPYHLLMLDLVAIFLLQWLIRSFKLGYRAPVVYITTITLLLSALLGALLDRGTDMNDVMALRAERQALPAPLTAFYSTEMHPEPPKDAALCRCEISTIETAHIIATDTKTGKTVQIQVEVNTPHATTSGLREGQIIFVAGKKGEEGSINAFGIRQSPPQRNGHTEKLNKPHQNRPEK